MSLPPCACSDPRSPSSCTCARSRQWAGHSHAGPSLFANSSRSTAGPSPIPLPQIALTTLHHAPHESRESHASHDSRKFHGSHAFPSSNIHTITRFCRYTSIPIPLLSPFASRCTCCTSSNFFIFKCSKTHAAQQDEAAVPSATEAAINELISSAKCELFDLLRSMDNDRQGRLTILVNKVSILNRRQFILNF
jgi:hypothetical protein